MDAKPYLLFDAGGTLIFPDFEYISRLAGSRGVDIEPADAYEAFYRAVHALDRRLAGDGALQGDGDLVTDFFYRLFDAAGASPDDAGLLARQAHARNREASLWCFTFPWVAETLAQLRSQGCRMSVISNSDGRVEALLRSLGLAAHLELIIDSAVVGVEKPDPRIFALTLDRLALRPDEALYIGDVFHLDVRGGQRRRHPGDPPRPTGPLRRLARRSAGLGPRTAALARRIRSRQGRAGPVPMRPRAGPGLTRPGPFAFTGGRRRDANEFILRPSGIRGREARPP